MTNTLHKLCSVCKLQKPLDQFSTRQLKKVKSDMRRCMECQTTPLQTEDQRQRKLDRCHNKPTIAPGPEKDVPAEPAPAPEWWSEDCTDNKPVMVYKKGAGQRSHETTLNASSTWQS